MSTPAKELKPDKAVDRGRAALAEWERAQSVNFYETDRHLQNILEFHWGADRMRARAPRLACEKRAPLLPDASSAKSAMASASTARPAERSAEARPVA